jgi:transcription initiation factor IIE alpha subunit
MKVFRLFKDQKFITADDVLLHLNVYRTTAFSILSLLHDDGLIRVVSRDEAKNLSIYTLSNDVELVKSMRMTEKIAKYIRKINEFGFIVTVKHKPEVNQ